jgi:hypothetical protein
MIKNREAELLALRKQSRELGDTIHKDQTIENLLKYKSITERMIVLNDNLSSNIVDMTKETIKWKQITLNSINILIMTHTAKLTQKSKFNLN